MIAPNSTSMNIVDREATISTVRDWKPDVVVHLAYRKDRRIIVDGSRHVAEAAAATGARLVHMSTDALFAGRPAPYVETDHPDPIIPYGRDKFDAEVAVLDAHPGAAIIRTSLLYGTDRLSPIQQQLAASLNAGTSAMSFFTDEFRAPAHADDVAAAISAVAARRGHAGVLHVAGPERVSRIDLARAMATHLGLPSARLTTSTLAESGMIRPGNVVLDSSLAASIGIWSRSIGETLLPH